MSLLRRPIVYVYKAPSTRNCASIELSKFAVVTLMASESQRFHFDDLVQIIKREHEVTFMPVMRDWPEAVLIDETMLGY